MVERAPRPENRPSSSASMPNTEASNSPAAAPYVIGLALADGSPTFVTSSTAPSSSAVTTGLVTLEKFPAARSMNDDDAVDPIRMWPIASTTCINPVTSMIQAAGSFSRATSSLLTTTPIGTL